MAIKASLRKIYDPFLTLSGVKHPFVGNQPVRFFGGTVQVPSNIQPVCELLQNKPTSLLEQVSCTPETKIAAFHPQFQYMPISPGTLLNFPYGGQPQTHWLGDT